MRILFIAPLPPPINGHSLAAQVLLDGLRASHDVDVVDLSRDSENNGRVTARRTTAVLKVLKDVWRRAGSADAVYLTISETLAGNAKDLVIYALCASRLSRTYAHLHGGSIGRLLFDRHEGVRRANRMFLRRLGGVIISGESHRGIFEGMIDPARIHIVPNFAQDHLFVDKAVATRKFATTTPLKLLYISSLAKLKGYQDLLDGFLRLPADLQQRVQIDFAGSFEVESDRAPFLAAIKPFTQLTYHGIVDEPTKQRLFAEAHVFCLPTAHLEGQPISILEAYASGCAVLTTGPTGIRDIFTSGLNGLEVQPRSPASIATVLQHMLEHPDTLLPMALTNHQRASAAYRTSIYSAAVNTVLESSQAGRRTSG